MNIDFNLKIRPKHLALFFLLSFSSVIFAQNSRIVSLDWEDPVLITTNESQFFVPTIAGQELSGLVPNYFLINDLAEGVEIKEVRILRKEPAPAEEVKYLKNRFIKIGNKFNPTLRTTYASKNRKGIVEFIPYLQDNGLIQRIAEIEVLSLIHI